MGTTSIRHRIGGDGLARPPVEQDVTRLDNFPDLAFAPMTNTQTMSTVSMETCF
ncbi:hypothetical protein GcM3_141005 [Golovinomyces cichoracearum]|uniref:Uncharacterized protein n=1 Tax=Golovinomyces cichoracearum TaxID=62708 RepID=A0A420I0F9_9PEZI|nr:hypothetical protein GcM3_141005 [Golovinomyces cichoracearum]